jgi:hypothetical protein
MTEYRHISVSQERNEFLEKCQSKLKLENHSQVIYWMIDWFMDHPEVKMPGEDISER